MTKVGNLILEFVVLPLFVHYSHFLLNPGVRSDGYCAI